MRIPNHIRTVAVEAFANGIAWSEFVREHGHLLREHEPYNQGRYHRLRSLALSIVTSGSTGGMFAAGDDDATTEWFTDDAAEQTTFLDTSEAYR